MFRARSAGIYAERNDRRGVRIMLRVRAENTLLQITLTTPCAERLAAVVGWPYGKVLTPNVSYMTGMNFSPPLRMRERGGAAYRGSFSSAKA